jgi:hypothetical protein
VDPATSNGTLAQCAENIQATIRTFEEGATMATRSTGHLPETPMEPDRGGCPSRRVHVPSVLSFCPLRAGGARIDGVSAEHTGEANSLASQGSELLRIARKLVVILPVCDDVS